MKVCLCMVSVLKHHLKVSVFLRSFYHASNISVYLKGLLIISDNIKHLIDHEFAVFCLSFCLGESGLMGSGIVIKIRRFLVQTSLSPWLGLKTLPLYKAPSDLRVQIVKTQ